MYNLLIALGIGLVGFIAGWLATGSLIAGILPLLLASGVAYFLLARRSGRQLEAIFLRASAALEAQKIDEARAIFDEGFALDKWQFLIGAQIHAQLGSIDYLQRNYKEARPHLEKAWVRHWPAVAMLAVMDFRDKKFAEALARFEKAEGPGGGDALFWGLYIWVAAESGDKERALRIADQALKKHGSSEGLKDMADALRNQKRLKFRAFGQTWYQFFPEHISQREMLEFAQQLKAKGQLPQQRKGVYTPPQPRGSKRMR